MTPAPDADGWIKWSGGKMPVNPDTRVHYRFADGAEDLGPRGTTIGCPAGELRWSREDPFTDIAAYRVVRP